MPLDQYFLPVLSHTEFYLLLAMKAGPAHGYELWQRAENMSLRSIGPAKSVAYRVITKLVAEGLAEVTGIDKSTLGRQTRHYDITPEGQVRLMSELRRMEHARKFARELGMFGRELPLEIERLIMEGKL